MLSNCLEFNPIKVFLKHPFVSLCTITSILLREILLHFLLCHLVKVHELRVEGPNFNYNDEYESF